MKSTTSASTTQFNTAWLVLVLIAAIASVALLATPYYFTAILPGLGLFFILFLGKFPQIGYYTIAFMIPFGAFRGSLPWVIAAALILMTLFKFLYEKRITTRLKSSLWPLLLCFVMINVLSSVRSEFSEYPLTNVMLLVVGYTFMALGMIFLSKDDFANYFPKTLAVSVSVSSLFGVFGYFFKIHAFSFISAEETENRAIGGSTDPNNMSLMVIFCVPITVNWLLNARKPLGKTFALCLLVLQALAVMVTYSRGGAMVFAITMILLLIVHAKRLKPTHWGFAVFITAATVLSTLYITPAEYWERLGSVSNTEDRAIGRRQSYITVARGAVKKHPIIGSGTGTFRDIFATSDYARMFAGASETTLRRYAHNTYIEHIVGSGILGLCFFLTIVGIAIKSFQTAYKKFLLSANVKMADMVRTYQVSFASLLCYMFFLSDIQHKYFLISLTLSQVALRLSREASEGEKG